MFMLRPKLTDLLARERQGTRLPPLPSRATAPGRNCGSDRPSWSTQAGTAATSAWPQARACTQRGCRRRPSKPREALATRRAPRLTAWRPRLGQRRAGHRNGRRHSRRRRTAPSRRRSTCRPPPRLLGVGRTSAYRLVQAGQWPTGGDPRRPAYAPSPRRPSGLPTRPRLMPEPGRPPPLSIANDVGSGRPHGVKPRLHQPPSRRRSVNLTVHDPMAAPASRRP